MGYGLRPTFIPCVSGNVLDSCKTKILYWLGRVKPRVKSAEEWLFEEGKKIPLAAPSLVCYLFRSKEDR
jgi:hypothetical protein